MKSKAIRTIYTIYAILLIFFIFQELFPILFILPTGPGTYLFVLNFPLVIGVILVLIPIFTARHFTRTSEQEYKLSFLIKRTLIVLINSALFVYFVPYVTHDNITIELGIFYSAYSGIFGLILIFFSYFQLVGRKIFFGFLIGTAGSGLGFSNHVKIFLYIIQQYDMRFEIGFYIGILTWLILFILNFKYMLRTTDLDVS
ncbi:MAG: hypothetical protein ACFE9R_13560 [Candidatus Hermodarchaeota archaeon]